MKKHLTLGLAALLMAAISLPIFAGSTDSIWQRELQAWRAQRAKNLQAPEGWLSLIGLHWLQEGDNRFGSAEENLFHIPAKVPAHVAVVRLEKGTLRLVAPAGGFPKELMLDGKPASNCPTLVEAMMTASTLEGESSWECVPVRATS